MRRETQRRIGGRLARMIALAILLASVPLANAYYHFVRYNSQTGPFLPIYEKFDLRTLPNGTVQVLIAETGPETLAEGDSLPGLVSQIRAAAETWNQVPTSALRVSFGGFFRPQTPANTPVIEVIFDEVEPGLIALGGPTSRDVIREGPGGPFVPILRSTVILRRDLDEQPSSSEGFFLSLVHEIGHGLGLQHTLASSVMSTEITRGTTKAAPLGADDRAGISLLYPAPTFAGQFGSISGRVTRDGQGVGLASVVAIPAEGEAVSALTNPDGSYRILGVPPGTYQVYVHPLPPPLFGERTPANIVPPLDASGQPLPFSMAFDTVFYPGVRSTEQATAFAVESGQAIDGVNFTVNSRSAPRIYAVQSFSFPGQVAVRPAHLGAAGERNFIVAFGMGLMADEQPVPGLTVRTLGNAARATALSTYAPDRRFLQIDMQPNPESAPGPKHLIFSANSDVYILPSGFRLIEQAPPSISGATHVPDANGNGRLVALEGARLSTQTRILFDGVPGEVLSVEDGPETDRLMVRAPAGNPGQRVNLVALNPDGQSSLFLRPPVPFEYPPSDIRSNGPFSLQPQFLAAGTERMIEIATNGTTLVNGDIRLAFGTGDVTATRAWVVAPDRIIANVVVAANASTESTTLTVTNGVRLLNSPFTVAIQPAMAPVATLHGPVVQAGTNRTDVPAGTTAEVGVAGVDLSLPAAAFTVTLGGRPVPVQSFEESRLRFLTPRDAPRGPAVLLVTANGEELPPLLVSIDRPPPAITAVQTQLGLLGITFRAGDRIMVSVVDLTENSAPIAVERVSVNVGGVGHTPLAVIPLGGQVGTYELVFVLSPTVPGGIHPLTVSLDGRVSAAYQIAVAGTS
jgi:hypothetical protein